MRILVISDIHGNIDALRAIDEPRDALICLGDIVDYGPEPAACIELLKQQPDLLRVRGNHDNAVAFRVDCECGEAFRHLSVATREYMWQILGREHLDWIGKPATSLETEIDSGRIFAVHAAPSNHLFKYLRPSTPAAELEAEAAMADADIILTGHSHQPFVREYGARLLVNVGSVGQPRDGIPRAGYALIEDGKVELKRADYDVEKAVARTLALPLDDLVRDQLAYILRHAAEPPI
ncbi:MAG: metallophosphoesterase family protein [Thermoleophilia bacterium]|nr:metallophosphoesterase family protein [Thermoleophilia bacterium]